jgi:hypothetical protein
MIHTAFVRFRVLLSIVVIVAGVTAGLLLSEPASSQSHTLKNAPLTSPSDTVAPPKYQIIDIGVVQKGDTASQGYRASSGGIAVGRSLARTGSRAFTWRKGRKIVGLPNLKTRPYCVSNGANDGGTVVGACANSASGTDRLPVIWQRGRVSQLKLPAGQTVGDATQVNTSGIAVGSAGGGSSQRGVIYTGGTGAFVTKTGPNGIYFVEIFGINDAGRVVGTGVDPTNAARNVGLVYDIGSGTPFEVTYLPDTNGAINFGVSNAGHVVGATMMGQGSGKPFIWTQSGGMKAIPLPPATTSGSGRAVNSAGWAVGNAGGQYSVPWLYDGTTTYRLQDLLPANSGWDLSTNTSASAEGISEGNIIVGTGVYKGLTHAYAMVPVTTTTP